MAKRRGAAGGGGSAAKDAPSPYDGYVSPLAGRYASAEMQSIWSARRKFGMWRRIWLAVAEAQRACGLEIPDQAIDQLRAHLDPTDAEIRAAEGYERELRHDVMAHVHALGDVCPAARPIIHLGMTSQDVNDNAELLLLAEAGEVVHDKLNRLIVAVGEFAAAHRDMPTLGATHYQPAQPTTVGRRAATWGTDLGVCSQGSRIDGITLRGFRGATGTQASFLQLFDADRDRVLEFEARALFSLLPEGHREFYGSIDEMGTDVDDEVAPFEHARELSDAFGHDVSHMDETIGQIRAMAPEALRRRALSGLVTTLTLGLTGQTYPRVYDALVLGDLGAIAAVLHKIATDIRLLSGRGELSEPTGAQQVGSSAMPHKRNPMKCERVCALARFVMNLVPNALDTAATQWLERTLDDSANRRLTLPEAFLALDGCLDLMRTVIEGLEVHEAVIRKNLDAELPFLAGENLMMQAVRLGRDRQDVHEAIRQHARAAADRIKNEGADNDLLERLKKEPLLEGVDFSRAMDPMTHIGLAREQVDEFVERVIEPLREGLADDDVVDRPSDRGV